MDPSQNECHQTREFREFVLSSLTQYETRLVHYATGLLSGDENRARDIVQHAFLKLCQQDMAVVGERVGPWLFRVCRNRIIDDQRRHCSADQSIEHAIHHEDSAQRDPIDLIERADLLEYVHELIGRLPAVQQEVVELWSHGLSHNEIAEIVDKSPGAVRGVLHRAIQSLKKDRQIHQWLAESTRETANQSG